VVPHTSTILFVKRTSDDLPTYVHTRDRGVRPLDIAYVHLQRVSVWLLFSNGSRLTLRVSGLVKTILLKTLLSAFMEKILINKKVYFYRGITLGVSLDDMRTSGENKVLHENLKANVRSRDQTYGPKYHNGRTAPSLDVWSRV
jgi:hypothetical protein